MCGRSAYSERAISAAATTFSHGDTSEAGGPSRSGTVVVGKSLRKDATLGPSPKIPIVLNELKVKDTPNAGPGNEFRVFRRSSTRTGGLELECVPMVWGLLPNNGTRRSPHPLPGDPTFSASPHYHVFNARSETVYEKKSFGGLIRNGQTCVLALDGYYEWTKSKSLHDKRKQPYFVRRKNREHPLLMAGLWSRVATGRKIQSADSGKTEEETITTFAILTTDAHPEYAWLHPRQPVMLWNASIALEWLTRPSQTTVDMLRSVPIKGGVTKGCKQRPIWETSLSVYPVSNKMSNAKYQGDDCTAEVKLGNDAPSVKSFFLSGAAKRAKTKTNADGSNISAPRLAADTPSLPRQCPTPNGKKSSVKEDLEGGISKERGVEEKSWTCSTCTFIHVGSAKFEYLACEVCLSERRDVQLVSSSPHTLEHLDASSNIVDRGRKRKVV